jgi:hypothetical protein
MDSSQFRRFLNAQRTLMTISGTSFGILLSVIANWISSGEFTWLLPYIAILTVITGGVALYLTFRRPLPRIAVVMRTPVTLRSSEDTRRYGREGFIGFVPLYSPLAGNPAVQLTPEARRKAVKDLDFDRLCLTDNSNLRPTMTAIQAHAGHLKHCWLISTSGENGSLPDARLLVEYLRQRAGLGCEFHYGVEYSVAIEDDVLTTSKTYDLVQGIFRKAGESYRISQQKMVGDITSGFRSMPLGMILASLNKDQDIEFVGTHYDEIGSPVGPLLPTIYGFEAQVQTE